jgi:hypothetical protein
LLAARWCTAAYYRNSRKRLLIDVGAQTRLRARTGVRTRKFNLGGNLTAVATWPQPEPR